MDLTSHALVKAPYEALHGAFRSHLKHILQEITAVQERIHDNLSLETQLATKKIIDIKQQLQLLKIHMQTQHEQEIKQFQSIQDRMHYLQCEMEMSTLLSKKRKSEETPMEASFGNGPNAKMNRLIIEYLLDQGLFQTAELIAHEYPEQSMSTPILKYTITS